MSKPIAVDDKTFDDTVLKAEVPVLVDFWAPWCGPCRMVAPIVDELAEEYSGRANFAKVNTDENPGITSQYKILSIPTLIVFNGGQPASQVVGYRPKSELKKILDAALAKQRHA
ncbi:MAG: thioredoxin [Chloroflexi bacterium]|nr:thioredoxin [Chloroflexota bacterium]